MTNFDTILAIQADEAGAPSSSPTKDGSPPFDVNAALTQVDGDEELLGELAKMLIDDLPAQRVALRNAVAQGDSNALERTSHALKGAVGNFGARCAYDRARDLEMIGRAGDVAHAEQGLEALEDALQNLEAALKQWLG